MVYRKRHDRDKAGTALPILIPGTRRDHDGQAYFLKGKQFEFVRRFTSDYIKKGTAHHTELKKHVGDEGRKLLHALGTLRAVAESGDNPETLKEMLNKVLPNTLKVFGRAERADVLLQHGIPAAILGAMSPKCDKTKQTCKDADCPTHKSAEGWPAKSAAARRMPLTGKAVESANVYFGDILRMRFADSTSHNPQREAVLWLAPLWTKAMSSARIVLWWAKFFEGRRARHFIPAIYAPDLTTAFYIWNALGFQRVCLGCGGSFVPDRPDQIYHPNSPCGDRHRKRRQRSEQKHRKAGS